MQGMFKIQRGDKQPFMCADRRVGSAPGDDRRPEEAFHYRLSLRHVGERQTGDTSSLTASRCLIGNSGGYLCVFTRHPASSELVEGLEVCARGAVHVLRSVSCTE